jgi:hypothetical protein
MHSLKIVVPGDPFDASIEMDGKPMEGVTRIELTVAPNDMVKVRLTMFAHVTLEAELADSEVVREIVHVERPAKLVEEEEPCQSFGKRYRTTSEGVRQFSYDGTTWANTKL